MRATLSVKIIGLALSSGVVSALVTTTAKAAEVYAYPNAGQTQEQQSRDRFECHDWAVRQTGFDPSDPRPRAAYTDYDAPPPPPDKKGGFLNIGDGGVFQGTGVVGDAATGAALGAAGGAIAGDAGEGAIIGAVASTAFGALNRSSNNSKQADYERERQSQAQYQRQQIDRDWELQRQDYNRAFGVCMRARDYTVQ